MAAGNSSMWGLLETLLTTTGPAPSAPQAMPAPPGGMPPGGAVEPPPDPSAMMQGGGGVPRLTGMAADDMLGGGMLGGGSPESPTDAPPPGTKIVVANTGDVTIRNKPVNPALIEAVKTRVEQAYGPGYTAVLYSGAQDESRRTGSERHDADRGGVAGDFAIIAPDGHPLAGAELEPLANVWIGIEGSMGINQTAGNYTHLDLVGGTNPASIPAAPRERSHWYYNRTASDYRFNAEARNSAILAAAGYEGEDAVKRFQADNGLKVDGKVGPITTAALMRTLESPGAAQDMAIAAAEPPADDLSAFAPTEPTAMDLAAADRRPTPPVPRLRDETLMGAPAADVMQPEAPAPPPPSPPPTALPPEMSFDIASSAPASPPIPRLRDDAAPPAALPPDMSFDIANPPAPAPALRRGDKGEEVRSLQEKIAAAMPGMLPDDFVDGDFGPYTQGVVQAIQKRAGIGVDGVVGPQTRPVIESLASGIPTPPSRPAPATSVMDRIRQIAGPGGPVQPVTPEEMAGATASIDQGRAIDMGAGTGGLGNEFTKLSLAGAPASRTGMPADMSFDITNPAAPAKPSGRTGPPRLIGGGLPSGPLSGGAFPTRTFDDIHGGMFTGETAISDAAKAVGLSDPSVTQGKSPPRLSLDSMPGSGSYAFESVMPASLNEPVGAGGAVVPRLTEPAPAYTPPASSTPAPGQPGYTGGGPTGGSPVVQAIAQSTGASSGGGGGSGGGSTSTGTASTGSSGGSTPPSYYDASQGGWQSWNSTTQSYQSAA